MMTIDQAPRWIEPFCLLENQEHARLLAHAFAVCRSDADLWPALRMARRVTGEDVFGYLSGYHFAPYLVDPIQGPWDAGFRDFEALKDAAYDYLEDH